MKRISFTKIIITVFAISQSILTLNFCAQNYYSENRLNHLWERVTEYGLGESLYDTLLIETDTTEVRFYKIVVEGKNFVIRSEGNKGDLTHVGLYLFNQNELNIYHPVTRFLEQKFLEYLTDNEKNLEVKLASDNVIFKLNSVPYKSIGFTNFASLLRVIKNFDDFKFEKIGLNYHISWKTNNQDSLEVLFPAREELISGKDKKELDEELIRDLISSQAEIKAEPKEFSRLTPYLDSIYIRNGTDIFSIFNSNTYYAKKDNGFIFLFDKQYPKESISNLFLGKEVVADSFFVNVEHYSYGGRNQKYTLPLAQIMGYFSINHDIFIGFENQTEESLTTTILYVNHDYAHLHMMSLRFPLADINSVVKDTLAAKLFTNIRIDNVENLFARNKESDRIDAVIKGIMEAEKHE